MAVVVSAGSDAVELGEVELGATVSAVEVASDAEQPRGVEGLGRHNEVVLWLEIWGWERVGPRHAKRPGLALNQSGKPREPQGGPTAR